MGVEGAHQSEGFGNGVADTGPRWGVVDGGDEEEDDSLGMH